jgi:hypothetical protein
MMGSISSVMCSGIPITCVREASTPVGELIGHQDDVGPASGPNLALGAHGEDGLGARGEDGLGAECPCYRWLGLFVEDDMILQW